MEIAIDFDGTCVTHEFPSIGKEIGAVPVLKNLVANGHRLILFTMRSDVVNPTGSDNELHLESGDYLSDAVAWFERNGIPLYGIQTNPTQHTWTTSPKAYAQLFIDDTSLGCPLVNTRPIGRPYVDWLAVDSYLYVNGIVSKHAYDPSAHYRLMSQLGTAKQAKELRQGAPVILREYEKWHNAWMVGESGGNLRFMFVNMGRGMGVKELTQNEASTLEFFAPD